MDFNALKNQVQNLTLHDIKKGVRSVQNVVMNLTDTESKVREATTNDPWGASSSLMREIADVSHYTEDRIQIMNMIDRRFHEKGPQEWRQIYKALQLLDYLIRNGDQEVVNAALESHRMRMLKVMKQSFHSLDIEGKDVGQNVRLLAGNILTLLQDTSSIREARREAAKNRNKYVGVSSDSYNAKPSRYSSNSHSSGGFGSRNADRFGTAALDNYVRGDGGIYGRRPPVEEYDEADDEPSSSRPSTTAATSSRSQNNGSSLRSTSSSGKTAKKTTAAPTPAPAPPPLVDLLDLGFDEPAPSLTAAPGISSTNNSSTLAALDEDDDFDDFQSAPAPASASVPTTSKAAPSSALPPPLTASKLSSVAGTPTLLGSKPANPTPPLTSYNSSLGSSSILPPFSSSSSTASSKPATSGQSIISPNPAAKPPSSLTSNNANSLLGAGTAKAKGGDAFGDLLSQAGFKKSTTSGLTGGVQKGGQQSLAAMNKKQLDEKLWGTGSSKTPTPSVSQNAATGSNARPSNTDALIDLF